MSQKIANIFICKLCNYECCKLSDYNKHKNTRKHIHRTNIDKLEQTIEHKNLTPLKEYKCNNCNKLYQARNSLWYHQKKCKKVENILEPNIKEILKEMLIPIEEKLLSQIPKQSNEIVLIPEIIKQNQDYQKQNQEFQLQMFQQMMELMKSSLTTNNIVNGNVNNNNNNYTQFNLQVYLNETCKNAMTINQFLDYLEPTVEELEATAHLGYVESISRIIMRGFKNLEECELPFHCSDLKREHIYIKNPDDEWVEEKDEKPLLLRFIKEVAKKSFKNLSAWQKKNPNWANYNSKQNDLFNKIVGNSVSGATEEEQQANYEKIMKNIMKNTTIDRSKKNSK